MHVQHNIFLENKMSKFTMAVNWNSHKTINNQTTNPILNSLFEIIPVYIFRNKLILNQSREEHSTLHDSHEIADR